MFGDDLGSAKGPLLSPSMYRKYFRPYHERLWKKAKEIAPNVKTQLHCCGGIVPLLNDLIDAGLDSINPVQVGCKGMEPETLKKRLETGLRFGEAVAILELFCRQERQSKFGNVFGNDSDSSLSAAVMFFNRFTTSLPKYRPRTSWQCLMRSIDSVLPQRIPACKRGM